MNGRHAPPQALFRSGPEPAKEIKLELVGCHDIGGRYGFIAHEFGDAGAHEDAPADVADDRIATVKSLRVCVTDAGHGSEDRSSRVGRPHIAREYAVALPEDAAVRNAVHAFDDEAGVEHLSAPGAIARMVRELHRVDRPDFVTETLHRKGSSGITDMAIGDMRLDRQDVHGIVLPGSVL